MPKKRMPPADTLENRSAMDFGSDASVAPPARTKPRLPVGLAKTGTRHAPHDTVPMGRSKSVLALVESESGEPTSNASSRASSVAVRVITFGASYQLNLT